MLVEAELEVHKQLKDN